MESLFFLDAVLRIFVGVFLGFFISLTGVGGGVLTVPAVSLLFSFSPTLAVGTASFYVALTKIYSTIEHHRIKNIDYKIAAIFLIGAFPANIFFAGGINYLLQMKEPWLATDRLQSWIQIAILLILFFSAVVTFWQMFSKKKEVARKHSPFFIVGIGFLIGAVIGITGVGGGVLIIPIFLLVSSLDTKKIVGTSIFTGLLLAIINSFLYSSGGQVDYRTTFYMVLGSFLGVFLASLLIHKISTTLLNFLIVMVVLLSFFVMLISFF